MRDLSDLFKSTTNGFLGKLNLTIDQKTIIYDALKIIKQCLSDVIFQEYEIHPRFMTQGSAGYKTQNQPCYSSQEIDYDLGCYLPFSDIEETGKPHRAANVFFQTVDTALEKLTKEKHWKGICNDKDTCCRVLLTNNIHIDIPLYSVPDKEFKTIHECCDSLRKSICSAESYDIEIDEESWENFDYDEVLLAHRKEGWKKSDPRKINMYFRMQFEMKGEQLRRICRYLKAWRDFKWEKGGPTSIYLMCLVEDLFESEDAFGDDIKLLDILNKIPERLKYPVKNKSEDEELKLKRTEDLSKIIDYAILFSQDLQKALTDTTISAEKACSLIQNHLGNRFPIVDSIPDKPISDKIHSAPITSGNSDMPLARIRVG